MCKMNMGGGYDVHEVHNDIFGTIELHRCTIKVRIIPVQTFFTVNYIKLIEACCYCYLM